jgi:hypothetical protein
MRASRQLGNLAHALEKISISRNDQRSAEGNPISHHPVATGDTSTKLREATWIVRSIQSPSRDSLLAATTSSDDSKDIVAFAAFAATNYIKSTKNGQKWSADA